MRYGWIQVARGVDRRSMVRSAEQGDGVVVVGESGLTINAKSRAEILLFDLQ